MFGGPRGFKGLFESDEMVVKVDGRIGFRLWGSWDGCVRVGRVGFHGTKLQCLYEQNQTLKPRAGSSEHLALWWVWWQMEDGLHGAPAPGTC